MGGLADALPPLTLQPITRVDRSSLEDYHADSYAASATRARATNVSSTGTAPASFSEAFGEAREEPDEPKLTEGELRLQGDATDRHVEHYWP
mmetsp:Transcript_5588/g.9484  ORF Transcript_5588/g.9484 Transcript_5588/m.9484 type:complete len:92 (-) Transcript_5588:113-388(-)